MRKLKLLGALLAMMAVIASSTASPAMATHWDYYDDPWGECGWMEVWDDSIFYPYYEFEGYEYDCHRWLGWDPWDHYDHFRDGPPRDDIDPRDNPWDRPDCDDPWDDPEVCEDFWD